jgi:predicted nucleotidyltransferase component of viral defense system
MIPAREVLALRTEWSLRADVIEKDWALGWVLAGIAAHPQLSTWIFKGGTCLRKCYYETYRFSEDLDFTVVGDGPEEPDQIIPIFREVASWLADEAGLEMQIDDRSFIRRRNLRGMSTTLGRVAYRGPSNPPDNDDPTKAEDRPDLRRADREPASPTRRDAPVL